MDGSDEMALEESSLRSALQLTGDDRDYLMSLDLAARWRQQPAVAAWWGWVSLAIAVAASGAWWLAQPLAGQLLEAASRSGLNAVLPRTLLILGVSFGQGVYAVATSQILTYALEALALVGVGLLAWPWSRSYSSQPQPV